MRLLRRRPPALTPLERLEQEGNDDFHLLAELGPADFSIEHLLELRQRARARLLRFDRLRRLNLLLAVTSLGWIGLGSVAYGSRHVVMAVLAFCIAGAMLLGFFAGLAWLKWRFDSRGELTYPLQQIEDELRRRAVRKPQKPRGA